MLKEFVGGFMEVIPSARFLGSCCAGILLSLMALLLVCVAMDATGGGR